MVSKELAYLQKKFQSIADEFKKDGVEVELCETEQDTRMKIIDRVITDVLGWGAENIKTEKHSSDHTYIDYLLKSSGSSRLVIEAKKTGDNLLNTKNQKLSEYVIKGPALQAAKSGIEQVRKYSVNEGVAYACLTNGHQWIVFRAMVSGRPYQEAKAIVFPSFDSISENFCIFYELLGKDPVLNGLNSVILNEANGLKVRRTGVLYNVFKEAENKRLTKSQISTSVDAIFDRFFAKITSDNPEMLASCFVETRQSRLAEIAFEKLASNLVASIEKIGSDTAEALTSRIEISATTLEGESVLIVGNKGAGKTTFIDRYFSTVLSAELKNKCVVLKTDLLKFHGNKETLQEWLTESLLEGVKTELFSKAPPSYDQLKGIFFKEYNEFREKFRPLYESDKPAFENRFSEELHSLQSNKHTYFLRLLEHCVNSRKKLPCIVFDNLDGCTGSEVRANIFNYGNSIKDSVASFIIFPVTDKTLWDLKKKQPQIIYPQKSFYLPIPPTKEVLKKRVGYLRSVVEDEQQAARYMLACGIQLKVSNVKDFVTAMESLLISEEFVSKKIGSLANFEPRKTLEIARQVMCSPYILVEDFFQAHATGELYRIKGIKLDKAIILNQSKFFSQKENSYILNLFELDKEDITSPLLSIRVLTLLKDVWESDENHNSSFISVSEVCDYFDVIGVTSFSCKRVLDELLRFGLVEAYNPNETKSEFAEKVILTPSGLEHLNFALKNQNYIAWMASVAGVSEEATVMQIRSVYGRGKLSKGDWQDIVSRFVEYCVKADQEYLEVPENINYESQKAIIRILEKFIEDEGMPEIEVPVSMPNLGEGLGEAYDPTIHDNEADLLDGM